MKFIVARNQVFFAKTDSPHTTHEEIAMANNIPNEEVEGGGVAELYPQPKNGKKGCYYGKSQQFGPFNKEKMALLLPDWNHGPW